MNFNRNKVIFLRKMRGWDQKDLADAAGLSRPYITQIENGTRSPSPPALSALAVALDAATADLLDFRCPHCGRELKISEL